MEYNPSALMNKPTFLRGLRRHLHAAVHHRSAAMRILNPGISDDLQKGVPLTLDLGAGGPGRSGFYSVDQLPLAGVDVVADLNEPLRANRIWCAPEVSR
jgi:adenylate cyclase